MSEMPKELDSTRCVICSGVPSAFPPPSRVNAMLKDVVLRAFPDTKEIPLCSHHYMIHKKGNMT